MHTPSFTLATLLLAALANPPAHAQQPIAPLPPLPAPDDATQAKLVNFIRQPSEPAADLFLQSLAPHLQPADRHVFLAREVLHFVALAPAKVPDGWPDGLTTLYRLHFLLTRAEAVPAVPRTAVRFLASDDHRHQQAAITLLLMVGTLSAEPNNAGIPVAPAAAALLRQPPHPPLHPDERDAFLRLLFQRTPPITAFHTALAAAELPPPEAAQLTNTARPLSQHLAYPGPESRDAALTALRTLSTHPLPWVRLYVAAAMADRPANLAVQDVIDRLANDESPLVRTFVAEQRRKIP